MEHTNDRGQRNSEQSPSRSTELQSAERATQAIQAPSSEELKGLGAPSKVLAEWRLCRRALVGLQQGESKGKPRPEPSELQASAPILSPIEQLEEGLELLILDHDLPPFMALAEATGHPWMAELATLEQRVVDLEQTPAEALQWEAAEEARPNPSLFLMPSNFQLGKLLDLEVELAPADLPPANGEAYLMLWRHPRQDRVFIRQARRRDLLALKLAAEPCDLPTLAEELGEQLGDLEELRREAVRRGLVIPARSRLRRPSNHGLRAGELPVEGAVPASLRVAGSFTLQWHITQACDLHCKHCYDRSPRPLLKGAVAMGLLDELWRFCDERKVLGHVCFTGGNPFLHPDFFGLYAGARERGLETSILGNPVTDAELERMCQLGLPTYYQVSLEGLEPANDSIRGVGNYKRVLGFLERLRAFEIPSAVMLTLTKHNLDQVIPLARALEGRVDRMTFNRLSQVGEGASLDAVPPAEYEAFLRRYDAARAELPHLRLKDNLFNILRDEAGEALHGGCTGYGCGAAFNFVAMLPDGGVHACRKLPSEIGQYPARSLAEIYESSLAETYRGGSEACAGCRIRAACGGCLAVSYDGQREVLKLRDPYCFYPDAPELQEIPETPEIPAGQLQP